MAKIENWDGSATQFLTFPLRVQRQLMEALAADERKIITPEGFQLPEHDPKQVVLDALEAIGKSGYESAEAAAGKNIEAQEALLRFLNDFGLEDVATMYRFAAEGAGFDWP